MKKSYLILIVLLFILSNTTFAQNSNYKIVLKYGIFLKKLVPNCKEGTFYAEFYWWTNFVNDSVQSGTNNEEIMNLQYVNGNETATDAIKSEIQEIRKLGNNKYYYTGYHQGNFFFSPKFLNYPFDKQKLDIEIEHAILPIDQLTIQPDFQSFNYSKMPPKFYGISSELLNKSAENMKINETKIIEGSSLYNSNFGDPDFPPTSNYSKLRFSVILERNLIPYITKLFVPLIIILFLVYFVFFIPADKLDMAAGLTVTSLLSAIAFQFTINGDLPEIGYMIYVDKIFYLTYVLIVLAMAESLITFYLNLSENEKIKKIAIKVDVYSRFLFPIIFLIFSYIFKTI